MHRTVSEPAATTSRREPVRPTPNRTSIRIPVLTALLALLAASVLCDAAWAKGSSEAQHFRLDRRADLLAGTLAGVSVGPYGGLELAQAVELLAPLEEPFVFSAAARGKKGWVLGTGSQGRVLELSTDGTVEELFAVPEPQVFAVHASADGTVYAAGSPGGTVYRYRAGDSEPEAWLQTEATYVWALAEHASGDLLVATGLPAKVLRVGPKGQQRELLTMADAHVRSLLPREDGSLLAGTAGRGLVLAVSAEGKVGMVADLVHPEVVALAEDSRGRAWAVALASEASRVELSGDSSDGTEGEDGEVAVVEGAVSAGSRSAAFSGARSVLLELLDGGGAREVAALDDETVHSLLAHEEQLWLGTGEEGRLYRLAEGQLVLEQELDERQLSVLVAGPGGAAVLTSNNGAAYRLGSGRERRGEYTSKVLDAGEVARFGRFHWQGSLPKGTDVELSFRSGFSKRPDSTWSEWSPLVSGTEADLGSLSEGRYLQWRATLSGPGQLSPRLVTAELSYRQVNRPPSVESLEVLEAGAVLVPSGFNPSSQTFEPWSPNREGIFTSLQPASSEDGRTKTLWKSGYRTLRWKASDPNEDSLVYSLSFRREGDTGQWLDIVDELDEAYFSFDSTVLPDGLYRFRLQAADRPAMRRDEALSASLVSEAVVVDHSVPELSRQSQDQTGLSVRITDRWSPLRRAEWSVDAGVWEPVEPEDGLLDSRTELLHLKVPDQARLVLLRVTDAAHNVVTFDLSNTP